MKKITVYKNIPGGGGCTPGGSNNGGAVICAALILLKIIHVRMHSLQTLKVSAKIWTNLKKLVQVQTADLKNIKQYLAVCAPDVTDSVDELVVTSIGCVGGSIVG